MRKPLLLLLLFIQTSISFSQTTLFKIIDNKTLQPVIGVTISNKKITIGQTDTLGFAKLSITGTKTLTFSSVGYEAQSVLFVLPNAEMITVLLVPAESSMEEVTIVSSTRSNQNIETAPIKIEVLDAEEMAEESTVKPATITGIIGDISGVQIQQTSAVSGNANVRIQGLDGRYTQILRDGLPLYEGFSGGFGITSIPPLDLKQIELIKGSSSTLYGAGAIGGLVNLISKRPTTKQEAIVTINQTTLNETNLNSFFSKRNKKIGYTFYAGTTVQKAVDVNDDGFSDVGKSKSLVLHPRLFFYPKENATITIGFTKTIDERLGGDMKVIENKKDSIHQFFEKNNIDRNSAELLFENNFKNKNKFLIKSSLSSFNRKISTASHTFKANQLDYFSEASYLINKQKYSLVTGINFLGNNFKKLSGDSVYLNNKSNNTFGAFIQYSYKWKEKSSVELGLRDDYQSQYGNFILPRFAIFHQINKHWGTRAGYGAGYKIPDALTPQIKDCDIENILPINNTVKVEKSNGYNLEFNYKAKFGEENSIFINHAFFLTQLNNPLIANEQSNGLVSFSSAGKPIITKGFDTYIKLHVEDWELYAGYTYTLAERKYLVENQFMPLTPKFRMAYMLTKEWEGKARFCIESSYNGYQYRTDYSKTPDYFFMAGMFEYQFGKHISFVVNVENLLDYKQSKVERLYSGTISNPIFNPLWAPIDGRVFNFCLKVHL